MGLIITLCLGFSLKLSFKNVLDRIILHLVLELVNDSCTSDFAASFVVTFGSTLLVCGDGLSFERSNPGGTVIEDDEAHSSRIS